MISIFFLLLIAVLLYLGLASPDFLPVSINSSLLIAAAVILLIIWLIVMYNTFAKLLVQVESSFSDITVQLKRRYDLIPQLVNTIKGSTKFETDTLEKVIQARSMAMAGGSDNPHDMAKNENMITGALKSIFALTESYPDLKSNQNFLALQTELSDTENKIQAARRFYNATVETYMGTIRMFPNNVLAKIFRFADKDFFEDDNEGIQNPVNVDFSK